MQKKELFRFPNKTMETNISSSGSLKIAVVGACNGAGASYISSLILFNKMKGLSLPDGLRSLVELGSSYFYNALGMDKRFEGRDFYQYSKDKNYMLNMEFGCNWFIKKPNEKSIEEAGILRALAICPGNVIVYDCSGIEYGELLCIVLDKMDLIYLVIDPLPTKLLSSISKIERIRKAYPHCRFVINKYNKGIHKGELNKFLGLSDYITIDAIDYSFFCKAEYNCVPLP